MSFVTQRRRASSGRSLGHARGQCCDERRRRRASLVAGAPMSNERATLALGARARIAATLIIIKKLKLGTRYGIGHSIAMCADLGPATTDSGGRRSPKPTGDTDTQTWARFAARACTFAPLQHRCQQLAGGFKLRSKARGGSSARRTRKWKH